MNKQQFGNFIAENRRAAGLTQKALAERLHVTDKAVSKWERALSYPDVTLLEPLAEALDMGVEELMACRRAEVKKEEEPVQNLLEISRESLKKEQRKNRWRIVSAVVILLAAALAVVWYRSTYVREQRWDKLVLKETVGGVNYLYVEEGDHLLRLKCGDHVDFDRISVTNERGSKQIYAIDCRWNRRTFEGTVQSCEADATALGTLKDMMGASIGLDYPLFGHPMVWCEYTHVYIDPEGMPICTFTFWTEEEGRLLQVDNCLTNAVADWDGDGEMELLIRTRWKEKPYTVYDMEDGVLSEIWLDALPPELADLLVTDQELYEQAKARMSQASGESGEEDPSPRGGEPL